MKERVIWLAILAAISMLLVAGAASAEIIAHYDGTVFYDAGNDWNMLADTVGPAYANIRLQNYTSEMTATPDLWGGHEVTFDGINQSGVCQWSMGVSDLYQIESQGALEFWYYRPTGSPQGCFMGFFDSYGTGAWEDQRVYVYNDPVSPTVINGVTSDGMSYSVTWGTDGSLLYDSWNHVVFTWDGASTQLYENGAEIGSNSSTVPLLGVNFFVGYGYGLGNLYYTGSIAQISIWNNKLSLAQVEQRYQDGIEGYIGGHVDLQDVDVNFNPEMAGIEIQLRAPGETTPISTVYTLLDANGDYSIQVPNGTYDVAIKASGWLREVVPNVEVTMGIALANVSLKNGDVDGDNEVTTTDLSTALKNMN